MIASGSGPLTVKFILPALTEATSPYWRPIKYSLFPPLGLATLAAYLSPDDQAVIVDEHVEPLAIDDSPELVVIQVYITNAVQQFPHLRGGSQLPISSRVVRIFDALNSKSYEPGLGKGLSAAAGKRFVNWAEFVGTESHRGSPALAWG